MKCCEEYAALLNAYFDGECTPEETERVRAHLAECPGCRAYLAELAAIRDAFPTLEDTEVPDGLADAVCAAVRADAAPRRAPRRHWWKTVCTAAACLALLAVLYRSGVLPPVFHGAESKASAAAASAEENASLPTQEFAVQDSAGSAQNSAAAGKSIRKDSGNTVGTGGSASGSSDLSENAAAASGSAGTAAAGNGNSAPLGASGAAVASGSGNSTDSAEEGTNGIAALTAAAPDYRLQASVILSAEQEEQFLAGCTAVAYDGYTAYLLPSEAFQKILSAMESEGLVVTVTENPDAADDTCCLLVYPQA